MYGKFQAGDPQPHFKRPHKKSRTGCRTCKQRRVKVSRALTELIVVPWLTLKECDETRPECNNCSQRGSRCVYLEWIPKGQHPVVERESSACSDDTAIGSVSTYAGNEDTIVSEVDLAHHFISHTCRTLAEASTEEAQSESWCVVVPALAVTSVAVRSGMLSLAACCMYTDTPHRSKEERAALLRTAYFHYDKCLSGSGRQLQEPDRASNLGCIIATTRILFTLGLAFCQIERGLGKSLSDAECWAWLPLVRGTQAVHDVVEGPSMRDKVALLHQALTPEMIPGKPYESVEPTSEHGMRPSAVLAFLRQARTGSVFGLRKALTEGQVRLSQGRLEQYTVAVDLLDEVMTYVCLFPQIHSLLRVVFVWPVKISFEFSEALTHGDKFALIIYAHWLMLTVLLKDLWIIEDMGRAGIFEIMARSGEWSEAEQKLLLWPERLLGVNV